MTADTRTSSRLAVALGALIALAVFAPFLWDQLTIREEYRFVDLDVYRAAGESVLIGRPVYEHLTDPPQLLPFTYPPVAALLASPLALLPWPVLQWVWALGQFALLAAVVGYAFRPARATFGTWWPVALGVLVGAIAWLLPVRDGFRFGQVDIALMALCLADCAARRPRWPRGLLVGVATAVKLTPAVFILYFWFTGRQRAAVVAAATAAVLTVAAVLVLPHDSAGYWAGAFFSSDRLGSNDGTSNQSLRGLLLRTPLDGAVRTAFLVLCVAVVAVVGFRRASAAAAAGDQVAGVAIVGLLAVLLSPVAWIHHLAWMALVLAVIADDFRDRRRVVLAVLLGAYFIVSIPWYGQDFVLGEGPNVLGTFMQGSFGLAAVGLVFFLGPRPSMAGPVGARVGRSGQPLGRAPAPSDAAAGG